MRYDIEHPGTTYEDEHGLPEEATPVSHPYDIGERVRVIHPDSPHHDSAGRIVRIEGDHHDVELAGSGGHRVRMRNDYIAPLSHGWDQRAATNWDIPFEWHNEQKPQQYHEGDEVMTKLGPARIQGTGSSPLGNVYRVELLNGTQDFDVWEQDISPIAQGQHMMLANAMEEPAHVTAWKYILAHRGGTFDAALNVIEADHGFTTGIRVEGFPTTERAIPADAFQAESVLAYQQEFGAIAQASDYKIGSWFFAGHYSMDLSQWFADRTQAILACIDFVQIAAFVCGAPEDKSELFVLTQDRMHILPEILDELQAAGFTPEELEPRLQAAHVKWAGYITD